jgi:hypothetical protein
MKQPYRIITIMILTVIEVICYPATFLMHTFCNKVFNKDWENPFFISTYLIDRWDNKKKDV